MQTETLVHEPQISESSARFAAIRARAKKVLGLTYRTPEERDELRRTYSAFRRAYVWELTDSRRTLYPSRRESLERQKMLIEMSDAPLSSNREYAAICRELGS